jgi:hypothetical protein
MKLQACTPRDFSPAEKCGRKIVDQANAEAMVLKP